MARFSLPPIPGSKRWISRKLSRLSCAELPPARSLRPADNYSGCLHFFCERRPRGQGTSLSLDSSVKPTARRARRVVRGSRGSGGPGLHQSGAVMSAKLSTMVLDFIIKFVAVPFKASFNTRHHSPDVATICKCRSGLPAFAATKSG